MAPLPVPVLLPPRQRRRSTDGIEYQLSTQVKDRSVGLQVQHREDNAREELLERAGLVVVRVEKDDLTRYRSALAERLASARADGLRRDRARDRWTVEEPEHWIRLPA